MMYTLDQTLMHAPLDACFRAAADVERWPAILPHYRFVRFAAPKPDGTLIVEMSANRPFGPLGWPTWWTSEMWIDERTPAVRYRHIRGVTTGMDVEWSFRAGPGGTTDVRIVHAWADGPGWPLVGLAAAKLVIGPVFVHGIASRTLAGIRRAVEARAATERAA